MLPGSDPGTAIESAPSASERYPLAVSRSAAFSVGLIWVGGGCRIRERVAGLRVWVCPPEGCLAGLSSRAGPPTTL